MRNRYAALVAWSLWASRTRGEFSERLRAETELGTLRDDLVGVVVETVAPAHVSIWLRKPGRTG